MGEQNPIEELEESVENDTPLQPKNTTLQFEEFLESKINQFEPEEIGILTYLFKEGDVELMQIISEITNFQEEFTAALFQTYAADQLLKFLMKNFTIDEIKYIQQNKNQLSNPIRGLFYCFKNDSQLEELKNGLDLILKQVNKKDKIENEPQQQNDFIENLPMVQSNILKEEEFSNDEQQEQNYEIKQIIYKNMAEIQNLDDKKKSFKLGLRRS